jgi:hypothetical protein
MSNQELTCYQQYVKKSLEEIDNIKRTILVKEEQLKGLLLRGVFEKDDHVWNDGVCIICKKPKSEVKKDGV